MAKLTKKEYKLHSEAQDIINSGKKLSWEERLFVYDNWDESAHHVNSVNGAFFTPSDMALHVGIFTPHGKVLDLCGGIGSLSFGIETHNHGNNEFVIVEINPDYAEIARRLMPDAEVITGSVYDRGLMDELRTRNFDCVVSNPPFGNINNQGSPRFKGPMQFEVLDIASDMAPYGLFIMAQEDMPFRYSGRNNHLRMITPKVEKFVKQTGIELQCVAVDTTLLNSFKNTNIRVEIGDCDFENEVWANRKILVDTFS